MEQGGGSVGPSRRVRGERAGAASLGPQGPWGSGVVDPSGCVSESRKGGGGAVEFLRVPQTQVSGPGRVFVPMGPIWARADAEGAPVGGVDDRAEGPKKRGAVAPGAGRAGATRRPPAPLPAVPWGPRRHSPRSGPRTAGRAALGLRQARSGPGSGGGRAIVRCIVGAARAGARAVEGAVPRDLYGPARPPARAAGAVRGRRAGTAGSGADAHAPPSLSACAPRALGLGSRPGRRRNGVAGLAAACVSPAAPAAAPGAARGLLGSGRLPALLPMHG